MTITKMATNDEGDDHEDGAKEGYDKDDADAAEDGDNDDDEDFFSGYD